MTAAASNPKAAAVCLETSKTGRLSLGVGGPSVTDPISDDFGGVWANDMFGQHHDYPYNHDVIKISLKQLF